MSNYLSFIEWNREYYAAIQLRTASVDVQYRMYSVVVLYVEYLALYLEVEHLSNCAEILESKSDELNDGYVEQLLFFKTFIPSVIEGSRPITDAGLVLANETHASEWDVLMALDKDGKLWGYDMVNRIKLRKQFGF